MLLNLNARSELTAAESRFTSPVSSTGEYWSTLPLIATLARDPGSDDSPLTSPLSPTMPLAKFGWSEWSAKLAEPSTTWTARIATGNGFDARVSRFFSETSFFVASLCGASTSETLTVPSSAMTQRAQG